MTLSSQWNASLLVCGRFHYHNYVETLAKSGRLHQFIYSHRRSTTFDFGGRAHGVNLLWKEYFYHAHYRIFGEAGLSLGSRLYHDVLWDKAACRALQPCDLLHFLMHGNCVRTVEEAKARGAVIVAEAVNGHPEDYARIIDEESDRLGVRSRLRQTIRWENWTREREAADYILVPSRYVQKSYELHGTSHDQIITLPYSANLVDFHPKLEARGKFKVVCMAQITARKGHLYLLKAWKKLNLPDAELHCYGYVDRKVLRALEALGSPRTFFHRSVPKKEVIRALQSAQVFVLPTIDDGFGVVILEAMAAGLPVITTENSGGTEVIKEGVEGFIVPIRDSDRLAERLLYLYENPAIREEMGHAARRKVEICRDWEGYATDLARIYARCVGTVP